jgi:RNA polymerase sigma factor (TIGR02999 family)
MAGWLEKARAGDPAALRLAFAEVYGELRRLAHRQLAGQYGRTLETTGLVHEAFLRLIGHEAPIRDRGHFFALAARVMRQVIVDFARERLAEKRGGGERGIPLDDVDLGGFKQAELKQAEDMIALDDVLQKLSVLDARQAQVVECRYFAGLTEPETAEALGISERSVQRDWQAARAWLRGQLA